MIDFLDATIPYENNGKIYSGYKVTKKKGNARNKKFYPKRVKSRNGSSIQIVSVDEHHLRIIGNPAEFIQGQNVFGSDDIKALIFKLATRIAKKLKSSPSIENKLDWKNGQFDVHRLDITYNFVMPSHSSVSEWLDKAVMCFGSRKQLVSAKRASSSKHIETLNLGESSRYISLKFYNKHRQLLAKLKKNAIGELDPVMAELVDYSKHLLRAEIRLSNQYLKKYGLTKGTALTTTVLREHFFNKLCRTSFGSSEILPVEDVASLTKGERLQYQLWLKGDDLKKLVSESTFERLRKKLLEFNLDIRYSFVDQVEGRSLNSYLQRNNIAKAPDFLGGTRWLFEPK
jgi:hypothetical protein